MVNVKQTFVMVEPHYLVGLCPPVPLYGTLLIGRPTLWNRCYVVDPEGFLSRCSGFGGDVQIGKETFKRPPSTRSVQLLKVSRACRGSVGAADLRREP